MTPVIEHTVWFDHDGTDYCLKPRNDVVEVYQRYCEDCKPDAVITKDALKLLMTLIDPA